MATFSNLANSLVGSEIVKLGNEINNKIANGAKIYNFTIGDFSPAVFPIPAELKTLLQESLDEGHTNYPPADGVKILREAISGYFKNFLGLTYDISEIQVASGGRPLIYALFRTVVNVGDKVIYSVPSWNNNHYTNLNGGVACEILTTAENDFMPTAEDIAPHIEGAALLCLCTPQNPTGTMMSKAELEKICDLVLAENARRGVDEKKLYVLFDQMYCTLLHGEEKHYTPIDVRPEMKAYTVFVDGISKMLSATGVRVGWSAGPADVIAKMKSLLSHIGAWAPTVEQYAVAKYLQQTALVNQFLVGFKQALNDRLWKLHDGFQVLKNKGFQVDSIAPSAAIYLTVKVDLNGKQFNGKTITNQKEVTQFLLDEVGLAIVPFYCFGTDETSPWYRISVGTCTIASIEDVFVKLDAALSQLQ